MRATIKEYIKRECQKQIKKHHRNLQKQKIERVKFEKVTGLVADDKERKTPQHWELGNQFNPFHVRSNLDLYSHTLSEKIKKQSYEPEPCLLLEIPKKGGKGSREISIFSIPDAAISKYLYDILMERNYAIFSAYAFAYRTDRNAHNAIEHLYSYVKNKPRMYVVEFDFSKFFDSISHNYIIETIDKYFKVNEREKNAIKKFLSYNKANGIEEYREGIFTENTQGVPQGTTISLLLANLACHELDKLIEEVGVRFARFSDDSVIVSNNYSKAHQCANLLIEHGKKAGTQINFDKSDGISLLTKEPDAEIQSKEAFGFLGHKISSDAVSIRAESVDKIKRNLSSIIHRHLFYYPEKYDLKQTRIQGHLDWDMVTCLNSLRRYIYGRLTERQLNRCISDSDAKLVETVSTVSFYPLVNDKNIWKHLDGWLLSNLKQAHAKRIELLKHKFPEARSYSEEELINGNWYQSDIDNETALPSFYKAWIYMRKYTKVYGLQKFPTPEYY